MGSASILERTLSSWNLAFDGNPGERQDWGQLIDKGTSKEMGIRERKNAARPALAPGVKAAPPTKKATPLVWPFKLTSPSYSVPQPQPIAGTDKSFVAGYHGGVTRSHTQPALTRRSVLTPPHSDIPRLFHEILHPSLFADGVSLPVILTFWLPDRSAS
uniref:Uncharacterized protein n=1 Tax=Coccidioides posadasii RMSCC 3488 TaxID=454284 RepID=A0A0J6FBP1_COCPO|nr:hypothetical protein CPAG_02718 [Coccidioides posadasii RMSCC 3488]